MAGTPYQSQSYVDCAKKKGFDGHFCTPGPTESNEIARRFMSVLNRTLHAVITKSKNPKVEVMGQMMNYPNTPQQSTWKAPSKLIMSKLLKTKVESSQIHNRPEQYKSREMETDKQFNSQNRKQSEFYLPHNVDIVPSSAHSTTVNQRDWVKECDSQ